MVALMPALRSGSCICSVGNEYPQSHLRVLSGLSRPHLGHFMAGLQFSWPEHSQIQPPIVDLSPPRDASLRRENNPLKTRAPAGDAYSASSSGCLILSCEPAQPDVSRNKRSFDSKHPARYRFYYRRFKLGKNAIRGRRAEIGVYPPTMLKFPKGDGT